MNGRRMPRRDIERSLSRPNSGVAISTTTPPMPAVSARTDAFPDGSSEAIRSGIVMPADVSTARLSAK
jgi:hypothetical protein